MLLRTCLSLLLLTSVLNVVAQRNDEEVLIKSQSLQSASIKSVEAVTDNGNISVEGVKDDQARIEVYAWSNDDDEKVKEEFTDLYDLRIQADGGKLKVDCKVKKPDRRTRLSVSFRIYVPEASSASLKTSGGNLHLVRLTGGTHNVLTSGGNIAFDEINGKVSGKTSGGNIALSGCSESFDVSTSGGNISARESKGKLLLFTSGGNIALDDLSGETKAETSGGNVSASAIEGTLTTSSSGGNLSLVRLSCALDAATDGGHMQVSINKPDRYVKLRNSGSGHTTLELPQNTGIDISATGRSVKIDRAQGFSGDMSDREVKGKLSGGGLPVTIDGGDSRVVVTLR